MSKSFSTFKKWVKSLTCSLFCSCSVCSLTNFALAPCFFDILAIFAVWGSSRPEVFCKRGVLRNFTKFTWRHLCQSLFFNKVAGQACNFIEKRLWHRCFPVNFTKFLRTPFLTEHLRWLLLCVAPYDNIYSFLGCYLARMQFCLLPLTNRKMAARTATSTFLNIFYTHPIFDRSW